MMKIIYLSKDERLVMLHYLLKLLKLTTSIEECKGYSYIEKLAKQFDMLDDLRKADLMDENIASIIFSDSDSETQHFFKDVIIYFLNGYGNRRVNYSSSAWVYVIDTIYLHSLYIFSSNWYTIYHDFKDPLDNESYKIFNVASCADSIFPKIKEEIIPEKMPPVSIHRQTNKNVLDYPQQQGMINNEILFKDI